MFKLDTKSCCIVNSGNVTINAELINSLKLVIRHLLDNEHVYTFVFGDNDRFSSLCYKTLDSFKDEYWGIEKIHVVSSMDEINKKLKHNSASMRDSVLFFNNDNNDKNLSRNNYMIDMCDFCIICYHGLNAIGSTNSNLLTNNNRHKSSTAAAYQHAIEKEKTIFNLYK